MLTEETVGVERLCSVSLFSGGPVDTNDRSKWFDSKILKDSVLAALAQDALVLSPYEARRQVAINVV